MGMASLQFLIGQPAIFTPKKYRNFRLWSLLREHWAYVSGENRRPGYRAGTSTRPHDVVAI